MARECQIKSKLIHFSFIFFKWQKWHTSLPSSTPTLTPRPADPDGVLLTQQQLIENVLNNMVFVGGGTYMMGTNDPKYIAYWDGSNTPAHEVTLNSFYMPKYLTSGQQLDSYFTITGQEEKIPEARLFYLHGQYPARYDWYTGEGYCAWLEKVTGLPFSLPTEAQWEYAAAGSRSRDFLFYPQWAIRTWEKLSFN